MKVLHIICLPTLSGFGSGHYLQGLLSEFPSDCSVSIIGGKHVKEKSVYNVQSMKSALPWAKWGDSLEQTMIWLQEYTALAEKAIKEQKPDIINVHHIGYPLLPAILCKQKFSIPVIVTVHGTGFMETRDVSHDLVSSAAVSLPFQDLYKYCDKFILLSQSQLSLFTQCFGKLPHEIINPGIDEVFNYKQHMERKDYFLYAGRIASCKGVDRLIELFQNTEDNLLLAGPIQDVNIKELPENVSYIGKLTPHELSNKYSEAKATIIPSVWQEPFGLVATESLACGTPVIALNSGALSEIVNEDNGMLCDSFDEIKEAIRKINSAKKFNYKKISSETRKKYSWKKAAKQYHNVYEEIVNNV